MREGSEMVQVQINITYENNKLSMQINQLFREDATEPEIQVGQNLENIIQSVLIDQSKAAGLRVRTKKVKKSQRVDI